MLRIGMVAGETSGDLLGAGLIRELKKSTGDLVLEGIGGKGLIAAGMNSHYPMEKLAVMGITEVMGRYLELRHIRKKIIEHFIQHPPDIFIGIDAPDFNLGLERELRKAGIKTVHYVSPSIWAWREYRINSIKQSVDLILTLFPFENAIYEKHGVPNCYVGHPLADKLVGQNNKQRAREELGIPVNATVVALLPGSRMNEINTIGPELLNAASRLKETNDTLYFVTGLADDKTATRFKEIIAKQANNLQIVCYQEITHQVMNAADYILLASGTAALEAMLLNRPMVVAYRVSWLSYFVIKMLASISYVSLPNILSGKELVAECLQKQCTGNYIAGKLQQLLDSRQLTDSIKQQFEVLSSTLAVNADSNAAAAIIAMLEDKKLV